MSKIPNYVFDDETELYHHGIKGQRWGDRRFQNEDGSLTPEGRERYGVGDRVRNFFKIKKSDQQIKADEQKAKAKISYNTQKYKADLKSKAQKEKDARAAEEERNRLKEQAKTEKMLKKEQGKIDRTAQKERSKTEQDGRPLGMKLTRTRKMSDEDLQKAVDRLKLQAEYNKQYVLATQPNGALAKADRFFEGPTGKAALDLAKAVLPGVASAATTSILNAKLKYANKEDRDYRNAETEKQRAEAESKHTIAETARAKNERENQAFKAEEERKAWRFDKEKDDAEYERTKDKYKFVSDMKDAELKRRMDASEHNHKVDNTDAITKAQIDATNAATERTRLDNQIEKDKQYGGVKYKLNTGKEVETRGLLSINDENRQLDTIHQRESQADQRKYEHNLKNAQLQSVNIANLQAAENVGRTKAITEQIRLNGKTDRELQKQRESINSYVTKQDADTRNQVRLINANSSAQDSQHNRNKDAKRVDAEVNQKNAQTERYRAQTNKQYGNSNNSTKLAGWQPVSNSMISSMRSMKSRGMSAEDIAEDLGVSVSTVWKYLYKGR